MTLGLLLCRDNPCPHLGNIVTIKLSENQENVPQTDNTYLTMIVETHFQVPYLNTFTSLVTIVVYHRERILETSTLSCNEEKEEITKPPTK